MIAKKLREPVFSNAINMNDNESWYRISVWTGKSNRGEDIFS